MRLLPIIATLTAGGLALTAWNPRAEPVVRTATSNPLAVQLPWAPRATLATPAAAAANESPRESAVFHKYRYLLADLELPAAQRLHVLALLTEREALAPALSLEGEPALTSDAAERRLAEIETDLRASLPPDDWEHYEMYRDSGVEQYQLEEYTAGLSEYAPLDAVQQRALLDARLQQKRAFVQLLDDAGLERPALSWDERRHAMALIEQGLRDYRESYLAEISPLLDQRQFTALASFEATEFQDELERLQRIVNAR